jgi:hypothetical protein
MRRLRFLAWSCLLCCACASGESGAPESPAGSASSGAEDGALTGLWAEYWAPGGRADTEQYFFFEDGRFGWLAADADAAAAVTLRAGHYRVQDGVVVLLVHREVGPGAGASPAEQRVELGDCPPNQEASAVDSRYRCISLDGDAFWRKGGTDAEQRARFFPE